MHNETTLLEYRIDRNGDKFIAIDSEDEVVGAYDTEDEAKRDIERAKLEDAMYKHSKILIHAAIASVMNSFDVDRDRARYLGSDSSGGQIEKQKPGPTKFRSSALPDCIEVTAAAAA